MLGPYSKQLGPFNLTATDQGNGVWQVQVALGAGSVGGGEAAGVVQYGGSLFANINDAQLAQLGFDEVNAEVEKILPAAEPIVEGAEALAESEIKSL